MDRSDYSVFHEMMPIFAYSFSSRGFENLPERLSLHLPSVPDVYLVSLYDYRYLLHACQIISGSDSRIRIWDSGGYETSKDDDLSSHFSAIAGSEPWCEETYVETACSIPWNMRDILVSYDAYENPASRPVSKQLEDACLLFEQIPGHYLRDALLHVDHTVDIRSLVNDLSKFEGCFDILGFTEKDVAATWFNGINFIADVRSELDKKLKQYMPLHLFGCFDPKSMVYFYLAGADIFDGLSWLRYFIHGRSTSYIREYEAYVPFAQLSQLKVYRDEVVANNVNVLQQLRSDLSFSARTGDFTSFADEMDYVQNLLANRGVVS
ncbi:MAG: hypothetical protein OXG23_11165 [Chloroflexi bacterium]|nr:hypothetical protein [Chloroflexota bacterium]